MDVRLVVGIYKHTHHQSVEDEEMPRTNGCFCGQAFSHPGDRKEKRN
jgi:hypothetical protein